LQKNTIPIRRQVFHLLALLTALLFASLLLSFSFLALFALVTVDRLESKEMITQGGVAPKVRPFVTAHIFKTSK